MSLFGQADPDIQLVGIPSSEFSVYPGGSHAPITVRVHALTSATYGYTSASIQAIPDGDSNLKIQQDVAFRVLVPSKLRIERSAIGWPENIEPGTNYSTLVRISNHGNTSENANLSIESEEEWEYGCYLVGGGSAERLTVAPGTNESIRVWTIVPSLSESRALAGHGHRFDVLLVPDVDQKTMRWSFDVGVSSHPSVAFPSGLETEFEIEAEGTSRVRIPLTNPGNDAQQVEIRFATNQTPEDQQILIEGGWSVQFIEDDLTPGVYVSPSTVSVIDLLIAAPDGLREGEFNFEIILLGVEEGTARSSFVATIVWTRSLSFNALLDCPSYDPPSNCELIANVGNNGFLAEDVLITVDNMATNSITFAGPTMKNLSINAGRESSAVWAFAIVSGTPAKEIIQIPLRLFAGNELIAETQVEFTVGIQRSWEEDGPPSLEVLGDGRARIVWIIRNTGNADEAVDLSIAPSLEATRVQLVQSSSCAPLDEGISHLDIGCNSVAPNGVVRFEIDLTAPPATVLEAKDTIVFEVRGKDAPDQVITRRTIEIDRDADGKWILPISGENPEEKWYSSSLSYLIPRTFIILDILATFAIALLLLLAIQRGLRRRKKIGRMEREHYEARRQERIRVPKPDAIKPRRIINTKDHDRDLDSALDSLAQITNKEE